MNPSVAVKITGEQWASYKRYKVNSVVKYNDVSYQNITGINSDPSEENSPNWISVFRDGIASTTETAKANILVNGNKFTLDKKPDNNGINNEGVLEVGDIIVQGWWDDTEYWYSAIFTGGDIDTKTSWNILNSIEEI